MDSELIIQVFRLEVYILVKWSCKPEELCGFCNSFRTEVLGLVHFVHFIILYVQGSTLLLPPEKAKEKEPECPTILHWAFLISRYELLLHQRRSKVDGLDVLGKCHQFYQQNGCSNLYKCSGSQMTMLKCKWLTQNVH